MNRKMKYFIIAVSVLVIILFIGMPVCKIVNRFETLSNSQMFEKGTDLDIDSLLLYDIKSRKDTLIRLQGIRLLNFWASWCKPCLAEMKSLQEFHNTYPEININLLSFEDTINQKKAIIYRNISLPAFFVKDTMVFKVPNLLPRTIILRNDTVIWDMYTARDWASSEIATMMDTLIKH